MRVGDPSDPNVEISLAHTVVAMMLTEEYAITRDDAGEKEDSARLAEELQSQVRKEREKRKQAQRERAKGKRMKTTEQVDRLPKETLSAADCVRGAADTRSAEDWALVRVRRIIGQGVVELVWKDGCVSVHDSPEVLQNAPLKVSRDYRQRWKPLANANRSYTFTRLYVRGCSP